MTKKESAEPSVEDLQETITALENMIGVSQQNQNGLETDNNSLRGIISDLQAGKSIPLIYSKMLAVKKDIGSVGKDQKNSGQGWKFRGIDQFVNALHPILNKHGVGILPNVIQHAEPKFITNEKTGKVSKQSHVVMQYKFFAEDGSSVDVTMPSEGVDPGDKGTNKALSAALKYALIQTFCVPTEDMAEADRDNATIDGDFVTGAKKKAPAKKEAGIDPKKRFKPKRVKVAEESDVGEL